MYRILCESLDNFNASLAGDAGNPRLTQARFLTLLTDVNEFGKKKASNDTLYQQLNSFLNEISNCPRCSHILHELKMLGIEAESYDEQDKHVSQSDYTEQHKLMHMILKLGYWY
jgi:hypothetical protein